MRATGIIRRIDELGRVVIPKAIRKECGIREGDPLEIFTEHMNRQSMVCFCKYEAGFMNSLTRLADAIDDEMMDDASNEQRDEVREHFYEIKKILNEWENGADKPTHTV